MLTIKEKLKLWNLTLSHHCFWSFKSSLMLYYINRYVFADILEKHNASFKQSKKSSWTAWPWRWRHYSSVKFRWLPTDMAKHPRRLESSKAVVTTKLNKCIINIYLFFLQEKNNMDNAEHLKNLLLISNSMVSDICMYFVLFAIFSVNFCLCLLSWYKALEYLLVW
jgi:hypothetical protein